LAKKLPLEEIAFERGLKTSTILGHLEKLKGLDELPNIDHLKSTVSTEAFDEISKKFRESEDGRLRPIFEALDGTYSYETLKLVRLFF